MELNGTDRCLGCMGDQAGAAVCPHCGRNEALAVTPPLCLAPGTRLHDQYVLGRVLGRGGFGVTYLAWDLRLDTRVAVKEYLPRDCATRAVDGTRVSRLQLDGADAFAWGLARFIDEARVLARFAEHPGVVSVLNSFEANDTAYMVMRYIDGEDLGAYLARSGPLPVAAALGILGHVLDALRAIHDAGLLHRDIAPDNIFLSRGGRVILLDFGTARDAFGSHTRSLALIHKPGYSPEEQYRASGQQGPWTDLYAAAATCYTLLTGRAPPEALERLEQDDLVPPARLGVALPAHQEAALLKALAVRAADRYPDVRALQAALNQPVSDPVPTPIPTSVPTAVPPARARVAWLIPTLVLVVAVLAGALLVALFGPAGLVPRSDQQAAAEQARRAAEESARQAALLEQARREGAEQARREAEAAARQAALEQARREGAEQARRELEAQVRERRAAEEQARQDTADKIRREAPERERQAAAERDRLAREQAEREVAIARVKSLALDTVRAYYGAMARNDLDTASTLRTPPRNQKVFVDGVRNCTEATILSLGPDVLLYPDDTGLAARVDLRVRVAGRDRRAQVWAGQVMLAQQGDRWVLSDLSGLSKAP